MMARLVCLLLPLAFIAARAQGKTTTGECSPIVFRNEGTLDIHCTGLDSAVAKQLGTLVTQVASLKKGVATESTQQQVLHLLTQVQSELTQVLAAQPKKLSFDPDRVSSFDEAFKKAIGAADLSDVAVEVNYEVSVKEVGRNIVRALNLAGIPTRERLSGILTYANVESGMAESGISAVYYGDKARSEGFISGVQAGLKKAGVTEDPIRIIDSFQSADGKTTVTFYVKK